MFKIESYVTPILLSYVDKYVRDFKPIDAQVSLWGGGVALHNLVLKADVLQQEVALPFTLVSGRIHELLIQVPWTKIMSEPIVVTIDTIECVLSLTPPSPGDESTSSEAPSSRRSQVVEAPPGYMQALVRRIVSNIALRVHHLIVKYVQDDIVLSLNVKHLAVDSAGADWLPAFADIEQQEPVIRRLVRLDDLTLCLDRADSDGKIRFYQEPLLYRCQLDLRVLTRLVSANTRRASSLSIQLRSSKLAWGVTSDQLVLLLRLLRERPVVEPKQPPPAPKVAQAERQPLHATSSNSAEPARQESWSDWAWSWLPTWLDREGAAEEAPAPAVPIPVHCALYLDDVSLLFKVMEVEGGNRKRARTVLELAAHHAAVKCAMRAPTLLRVHLGVRALVLSARGKCVCGHVGLHALREETSVYLCKVGGDETEEPWSWPEDNMGDSKVELAQAATEGPPLEEAYEHQTQFKSVHSQPSQGRESFVTTAEDTAASDLLVEMEELWIKMAPLVYIEYTHERSPPDAYINPYENPPANFEYSDWSEECNAKVRLQPLELRVGMGLLHRLGALAQVLQDLPKHTEPDLPTRTLTVEECDALMDNLPQRRATIEANGLRVRLHPWDHSLVERPAEPPLALELLVPRTVLVVTGPLYPHRVCSAACQIPKDSGTLWDGARLRVTLTLSSLQVQLSARDAPRPCARADLRLVLNLLLNKHMFTRRESVVLSYNVKIRELNVCGSAARLQAAWHVPASLLKGRISLPLKYTTLAKDALADEESVAIDFTMEDTSVRGYMTENINTHIFSMQCARATALHAPKGADLKQAWLFSAPDVPTTTPYLRCAVQWCQQPMPNSLDYVGLWTEPVSFSADPLFIAWLAYKPTMRLGESATMMSAPNLIRSVPSSQYFLRRRTPPSAGSRGTRGSGAELVHQRPRSLGSSSEPSERREDLKKQVSVVAKPEPAWGSSEWMLQAYSRLRGMLVHVELGLVLVYASSGSASALDCATLRDALERHATCTQSVLVLSLGRISMHSNSAKKHLWQEIRHDGPTFIKVEGTENTPQDDSFPWKMRIADVSCYTLELFARTDRSRNERGSGLRSQLKASNQAHPKTVLELVSTTVTLSVVTKAQPHRAAHKAEQRKHASTATGEDKTKYFTEGTDFKPSTLKEFFRGPAKRKKSPEPDAPPPEETPTAGPSSGPIVSLGVHVHADTPPISVRIDHEQVHMIASALHGVEHIVTLLNRGPVVGLHSSSALGLSHRSTIRSVSEMEEGQSNSEGSENRSDLISIFESQPDQSAMKLKTFFWFQWVVSRATLVVATYSVKLAFETDDIISTVDLQQHYNQLKVKIASASVRHYERVGSDEWTAGVLEGRVLEAREPTNPQEDNHFMSITVTQAQISNLPANWKEELHPKLLDQKNGVDSMWEIYATLAPLEVVVQPTILENVMSFFHESAPRSLCPLQAEVSQRPPTWQWPFLYVNAGGLRLLVTSEEEDKNADDTFMLVVGKMTINPHPENPICRRTVTTGVETNWLGGSGPFEGRQYEMIVHNFAIRSAQFSQIVYQEASEIRSMQSTGGENPALKWSQPVINPAISPILHAVDIGCVVAPAMYVGGALACGPAVEFNLVSDCAVELSVQQLDLMQRVARDVLHALARHRPPGITFEEHDTCPYASLLRDFEPLDTESLVSDTFSLDAETIRPVHSEAGLGEALRSRSGGACTDSGVDTVTSHSTLKSGSRHQDEAHAGKKSVSIFVDHMADASEFLEVFVTMGTIELSLYVADDNTPEVTALRPPAVATPQPPEPPPQVNIVFEASDKNKEEAASTAGSKSRSDLGAKNPDMNKSTTNLKRPPFAARRFEGSVPLVHFTFHQPNLYYWRRKAQKSLQASLFNAWIGLGGGQVEGQWSAPLLTTARGAPDPATDIPPALVTMKTLAPVGGAAKGSIKVDVERPVQLQVCTDRLRRLKGIQALISSRLSHFEDNETAVINLPFLYRLRRFLLNQAMESISVSTSQLSACGSEGAVGCDGATLQVAAGARPERVSARLLLTALLATAGPPADRRHVLLQPMMMGAELEATWDAWRRLEGGMSACEPSVHLTVDLDRVTADLRPCELAAFARLKDALQQLAENTADAAQSPAHKASETSHARRRASSASLSIPLSVTTLEESTDHYYKDDLRSGAFKIVSGGQLPMAYQVTLHGPGVAWRYPHPRAITRIVAFPLPDQDEEVECVLELYSPMLLRWHAHTYFRIPVGEPRELQLCVTSPDTVFAHMWRYRACVAKENVDIPFEFDSLRFAPRSDPLLYESQPEMEYPRGHVGVSAEQLSGVVRVDSYFAPRALPHLRMSCRLAAFSVHLHNSLPFLSSQVAALEGYYVSRPLMRSHRVLTLSARDAGLHAHFGSPEGYKLLCDAKVGGDVLDCATGTMEQMVEEFRVEGGVSVRRGEGSRVRLRGWATPVHVALHVPRLRTLHALAADWRAAHEQYLTESESETTVDAPEKLMRKRELAAVTGAALDGRVSLWLHNSCASALRIGQEGTDEIVPLGPGARLAYRWRGPTAPKKLRVALAGPTADWHWSSSVGFTAGSYRIRLEDAEALGSKATPGGGVYAHIRVEETGPRRSMHIGGRLSLANMLRYHLLYKVRARCPEASQWRTVCSGELEAESVGRSVMCGAECEMTLKIKFMAHTTGWSGDIPLKECPKENVPWLVKVPSEGEIPYVSVWCRVVRARSDGRVLATVWPLYVLNSHLPLDTDVLIVTDTPSTFLDNSDDVNAAPLVQTAPGRGTTTHLVAPGTTSARHSLSFQYRNIECPVTREAIPLHYGVTDTSVFDKQTPVATVEEVVQDIISWVDRSGRDATSPWPYSLVTKHWPGKWQPALLQPRCDVTVRYQAVRAGGGCCLELQLCPLVLLCNASPIALTLRAHDAAPLCKLESGAVIAPPANILKKPFFISVEVGRETFVSEQLELSVEPQGPYGAPPAGRVTLDHAAPFIIHCNQKVALLTLYYEIKQDINVIGISTTFTLINRLNTDVLVSAVAVPIDPGHDAAVHLRPKTFKVAEPTKEGSMHGMPLCRFWLRGRWRPGDPMHLAAFLCVALPAGGYPVCEPTPVRLGEPPLRRAFALRDVEGRTMPVVVTQLKHESRWLVMIAPDPCPQFLVHNRTHVPLVLAQPRTGREPSTSRTEAVPECDGARWRCVIPAGAAAHYSSPMHCARYPPPAEPLDPIQLLTLGRAKEEGEPEWCPAVAVADGEQLLQLSGGVTVKMRVRSQPHSTLLDLLLVDENDISASDIRNRLFEPYLSKETLTLARNDLQKSSSRKLLRIGADDKLLDKSLEAEELGEAFEGDPGTVVMGIESDTQLSVTTPMPDAADRRAASGSGHYPQVVVEPTAGHDSPLIMPRPGSLQVIKDAQFSGAIGEDDDAQETKSVQSNERCPSETSYLYPEVTRSEWEEGVGSTWSRSEWARLVVSALSVELSASAETRPLVALHINRAALLVEAEPKRTKTTISIAGLQIDNLQYESGQFDFGVVASTPMDESEEDRWPPLFSLLVERRAFGTRHEGARVLLHVQHDTWTAGDNEYTELTELDISVGPLALYVEDAYVSALVELARLAAPPGGDASPALAELRALQVPLRLQLLHVRPLDLTLTLHTAVRMYIALDQSPLHLGAFKLHRMMTSVEQLTHALTVHYLSAAILGAGWVVGGLELLGAPGALAARVGGASGGVRGVASAAAAALVRSLSAWAGSLARNLDLLAGDEEHARRAAAARRRPPPSLVAGLAAGITNFAINILGAVGGLAHHPLVGVAVGETASGAAALRRGLLGALTKPLSATADLVAYAGHGLLTQTGWDPVPQPRPSRWTGAAENNTVGWRRDCVRWTFRLAELTAHAGFEVLLDNAPLQLLFTHKFLVVADLESEKIVEMIDFRFCTLEPYKGPIIQLCVRQRRMSKNPDSSRGIDEDDEYQISAAAMARVARYTGASGPAAPAGAAEARVLSLLPPPGRSHSLHAALAAAIRHNSDDHFALL